jgi:transposase
MMKITVDFSNDVEAIKEQRFLHPDPKVQLRLEALFLKFHKIPHEDICRMLDVHITTLSRWIRTFREEGLKGLMSLGYGNRKSDLEHFKDTLKEYFEKNPPATVAEAAAKINDLTGVQRGLTQVRHFLRSMGFKFRKAGSIPGKVDPEKQEEFKKKLWNLS